MPKACRIIGERGTGKTAALARRAQETPDGALFVCAFPAAANSVRNLLPPSVRVMTAQELALWVLDEAGDGRTRLLEPFEEQFLFEDLRTTGLPQKQLRNVLEYLLASLAACKDRESDWLDMREERLVYDTMMATLRFTGGTVEAELANRALRALENAGLRERLAFEAVFVDDYGLLNRSSQLLCNALVRASIAIAGEPGFLLAVHDRHPNPEGLDEFARMHPVVEMVGLATDTSTAPREETRAFATLKDEFDAIVSLVKEAGGKRVAVVAPNRTWLRNMARTLKTAGIPTSMVPGAVRIRDFSDEDACARARARTLERLAIDPHDGVALRSLFGFGDHLARSAEFKRLRESKLGASLADFATVPDQLPAPSPHADDSTEGNVVVCSPEETFGLHFDLVVFGGCVAGWIPPREAFDAVGARKQELLERSQLSIECARRAARERLVFTRFSECDLEFAERFGLHYQHVRLRNGVRTCELASVPLQHA